MLPLLKKSSKLVLSLTVAVMSIPLFTWNGTSVYAEGPTDPAPYINAKVVNENAGKKVLFDNTHGQTAGAADWVIDGAFSDFANGLANDGFYVKELRKTTPITFEDLKSYDVFVVGEANIPYKKTEQDAMQQYVEQGGSIFFIADHYNADRNKNRWDASEIMNGYRRGAYMDPTKGMSDEERNSAAMQGVTSSDWLNEQFGVRFRYNAIGDVTANHIVAPEQSFGITSGVSTVAMHAGSTLMITDPNKAKGLVYLPTTDAKWPHAVDQGVYMGGGVAEGPYMAIAKKGQGKAAFIGDSSPVEDITPKYLREETGKTKTTYDGFKEQDDATLLINTVNWLAKKESYTSLNQVPELQLDQPTPTLEIEDPASSTEPQPEPWSAPAAGYKWWDSSTFKPGSYGSSQQAPVQPTYATVHQSVLPNNEEFGLRVVVDKLLPGQVLSGLNLGIYLTGGTQVGMVKNSDGTWPTSYSYSSPFSVTADSLGHAKIDLTVKVKPGTSGPATLRLRLNKTAVKSEAVTLDNVPAESLPEDKPPVPATISIAEARTKAPDTIVSLEGVITNEPGLFGSQGFYMQDGTAGIYVYQSKTGFHQGDRVKITAPTTIYNNEFELTNPILLEKFGTETVPAPKVVSVIDESNQGQLVRLEGAKIANIASSSSAFEFDAVKGEQTTRVRVDARTGFTFTDFQAAYKAGDTIHVTGLSSVFKTTKLIRVRSSEDLQLADVEAPVTNYSVEGTKLSTGSYLGQATLSLQASDAGSGVSKTEYRFEGQDSWEVYSSPIVLNGSSSQKVEFRSVDVAGNIEPTQTVSIPVVVADLNSLREYLKSSQFLNPQLQQPLLNFVDQAKKQFALAQEKFASGKWVSGVVHTANAIQSVVKIVDLINNTPKPINSDVKNDINLFVEAIIGS